jgi:hypothetical protein
VDTVVTRCRCRETDKKRVEAEIYDAENTRRRDGDAKRTVGRSSLSPLFFCICGAACTAQKVAVDVAKYIFLYFCSVVFVFLLTELDLGLALDRRDGLGSGDPC